MKETHKQVREDFKSGSLTWKDISVPHIQEIGRKIVNEIMSGASDTMRKIRDGIMQGFKKTKSTAENAGNFLSGIFKSVFGGK